MKKIFNFLLISAMILAMGASVVSCSSDDEEEEEYVPVESPFAKLLREKPVHQLSVTMYQLYIYQLSYPSKCHQR